MIEIRFCQKSSYAVWETYSNGDDFLLKKGDGIFINNYKFFDGIIFASEDIVVYDFDFVREMLGNQFNTIDYKELLNF